MAPKSESNVPAGLELETSLGFVHDCFPVGVHICHIFSDDDERQDLLMKFLMSGVRNDESTNCFSDNVTMPVIEEMFEKQGVSHAEPFESGALTLNSGQDVYFQDGRFDPQRILAQLGQCYDASVKLGCAASRAIGEVPPRIQQMPGGERLVEYEAKVTRLLRTHPVTSVCQYDARAFDGSTIMEILRVHPLMVLRGSVIENPFFIPPEEFLKSLGLE